MAQRPPGQTDRRRLAVEQSGRRAVAPAGLRAPGSENVVEGVVLLDEKHHVLDWRGELRGTGNRSRRRGQNAAVGRRDRCTHDESRDAGRSEEHSPGSFCEAVTPRRQTTVTHRFPPVSTLGR